MSLDTMLLPQAYDDAWSQGTWRDGAVFNDYPPPPPAPGSPAAAALAAVTPAAQTVGVPNGTVRWRNPCVATGIPLNLGTPTVTPVLVANPHRNLLIIQNTSTATAPDVASNLLVNFASQAISGQCVSLAPGVGLVLDVVCPRNEVYIAFAGGSNPLTSTNKPTGTIQQGSHTLDAVNPPAAPAAGETLGHINWGLVGGLIGG